MQLQVQRLIGPWRPGDLDGFLALGLNNLIQILLIISLCQSVLGYPQALLFGQILPAAGVSLLVGNVAYTRLARQLAASERRDDCTAMPYGINTVSLFAYIFLVMLPVKLAALNGGMTEAEAISRSWHAGMVACMGSGLIEMVGAFSADRLRRWLPRAALLSTLAGIALGYIALGFLLRTYAQPLVGLMSLAVIVLGYYAKVRWPLPTGLMAVILGMVLAWSSGLIAPSPDAWQNSISTIRWHPPTLQLQILWENRSDLVPWLGVIIPMGLFNVIGSLQNLDSAEAAGDRYATRTCLLIDGMGTLAAAALGSCFPTTIYIGHSGFKEMGARSGYSWLNGVVMAAACFFGLFGLLALLIPIDAGMAIVLYIGIAMTAQAFQATPSRHAPAVVLGLLPGLAGWGAQLLKAGLRTGGLGTPERPFNQHMVQQLASGDVWAAGAFALEQGQIITAMLLAALLVFAIEGRFLAAATCSGVAAVLAWFGVIHAWQFSTGDTVVNLGWGTGQPWAIAYAGITVLVLIARRLPKQPQRN
ncbi:NCS2 family permease [Synechococcus sp. AH-551-N17]|nr:NCS2 family permease [Synechococcus sp. AH-551-N17]